MLVPTFCTLLVPVVFQRFAREWAPDAINRRVLSSDSGAANALTFSMQIRYIAVAKAMSVAIL